MMYTMHVETRHADEHCFGRPSDPSGGESWGLQNQKKAIEEALKILIQVKAQEKLKALRGKIVWQGDLEAMRTDA